MTKKWHIILILSIIGNLFILYVAYKALDYRSHVNYFLNKYTYVVEEFASRNHYADENRRLSSQANSGKRVIFLGAQIMDNWEIEKYFSNYEAINRGISGQRLAGYLLRFRPDVVELGPKAVIIEFSSFNFRPENSVKELEDYFISLVDIARQNDMEPILTTVVPVRKDFDSDLEVPYNVQDSLKNFNQWLVGYCRTNKIKYVDFAKALSDNEGYLDKTFSTGQITLSQAGYDKISKETNAILEAVILQ